MAIKILSGALSEALGRAELPLSEKWAKRVPILTAVKLAAGGDGLSVTRSSFDGTIVTTIEATGEGEVAVPFERLAALAGHFPADAELTIGCDGNVATVASGRSRFKLPVFPLPDIPERHILGEETGRVEIEAKAARDLFARPAFAASSEANSLLSQRHLPAQRRRRSCCGCHRRVSPLPRRDAGNHHTLDRSHPDRAERNGQSRKPLDRQGDRLCDAAQVGAAVRDRRRGISLVAKRIDANSRLREAHLIRGPEHGHRQPRPLA